MCRWDKKDAATTIFYSSKDQWCTMVSLHNFFVRLPGMDRRSLFEAEAEAEAEGKKPSAFGRRQKQKQKVFKFEILKIFPSLLNSSSLNQTKLG